MIGRAVSSSAALAAKAAYLVEAGRVLWLLPRIELERRRRGTGAVVAATRARGRRQAPRTPDSAARLRRVIAWIDRRMPAGPNCYRRALLTIALDAAAATRPLRFGLRPGGGVGSGHVWIAGSDEPGVRYDVEFEM